MTDDTDDTETLHVLETRESPAGEWTPHRVYSGEPDPDDVLDVTPARVVERPAEELVGTAICGAETSDGGRCTHPAGSCPVPSHE